jgi:hypothetical protein
MRKDGKFVGADGYVVLFFGDRSALFCCANVDTRLDSFLSLSRRAWSFSGQFQKDKPSW